MQNSQGLIKDIVAKKQGVSLVLVDLFVYTPECGIRDRYVEDPPVGGR
jgi:hypothetical protein